MFGAVEVSKLSEIGELDTGHTNHVKLLSMVVVTHWSNKKQIGNIKYGIYKHNKRNKYIQNNVHTQGWTWSKNMIQSWGNIHTLHYRSLVFILFLHGYQ